jgi:sulfatase modifying factor 1
MVKLVGRSLVIATPENLAQLSLSPDPPQRIWWEKAEIELCLVPAGEFLMGISEEEAQGWLQAFGGILEFYADASPQRAVTSPAYYIGRYPVTNAQYARFVQTAGYDVPFVDAEWAEPYNWDKERRVPPRGKEDHPVTLVSWEDAVAYCEWAELRLPTEAEWEKAARGTDGRLYPWGDAWDNEKCNSVERIAGRELLSYAAWKEWWAGFTERDPVERNRDTTTAVGTYSPGGDSPYGCADMAGNVWEWCADWYQGYPGTTCQRDRFGETERVLRGGTWFSTRQPVRTPYRSGGDPGRRVDSRGFRCCVQG